MRPVNLENLLGKEFSSAATVVRSLGMSKAYVVGDSICSALAGYAPNPFKQQWIFLVDTISSDKVADSGWRIERDSGQIRMSKGNNTVTIRSLPLDAAEKKMTIEEYLADRALTTHAVAYDLHTQIVQGAAGIYAATNKIVQPYNVERAASFAQLIGVPLDKLLERKARAMRFSYTLEPYKDK